LFATSGIDKFAGVAWSPAPGGAPLLDGALAHLEGRIVSVATHGDHELAVVAIDFVTRHEGRPLVYYRGGFAVLA
jgi:3-hydroxy-9,10-secoandrosta-1,3,5(10)-triene-9,17-dione monooxygenase reductase component